MNELHDSQFRCKMRYKYLITIETLSFYKAYEVVEQISHYITSKKQTLKNEFEKKISIIMQTQNMIVALKFVVKNQSNSFKKSKSMSVDRIERYRSISQQHKKFEIKIKKNIAKKNNQSCEIFATIIIQFSKLKSSSNVVFANKLTQSYINANFLNSNVSILNKIFERSQITSHFENSIFENMMTLSSQSQSICDSVFNEEIIELEKFVEREKSIENYVFESRK